MSLPRELVYIQEIEMAVQRRDEAKRQRSVDGRQRSQWYLQGLRRCGVIAWGETKEQELFDRATSPDDSTM